MDLQTHYLVEDIITGVSCILVFVSIFLAYRQYRHTVLLKRASYLNKLINKLKKDTDIRHTIYDFQYGKFKYDGTFHAGSELEIKVDKTLQYLNYICYLKSHKIINDSEFDFFKIDIILSLNRNAVQNYLYNLYHFEYSINKCLTIECGIKGFSFGYLISYAKSHGIVTDKFFDKDSYRHLGYTKILDF